jgi:hypothetical protein
MTSMNNFLELEPDTNWLNSSIEAMIAAKTQT